MTSISCAEKHTCTAPTRDYRLWTGGRTRKECELHIRHSLPPHGFKRTIFSVSDGSFGIMLSPK